MPDRETIQLPPGVFRQGSEAEMAGKWYETNLVRWTGGVLRPVGGWERLALEAPFFDGFPSPIRAVHVWVSAVDQIRRRAVFCEAGLYIVDDGGDVLDITPADGIQTPTAVNAGGYGERYYPGASDGYTPPDTGLGTVYPDPGSGYGTPRPDKPVVPQMGPMWSLDNFGDDLLAMASSDGRLLIWKPSDPPGTKATEVVADTGKGTVPRARFFVVTPQRHVMCFQDGDIANRFEWCAQEDVKDWNYADINSSAGYYDIQPAQPFLTAAATRYGILAFTVNAAYVMVYVGTPYIYSYNFLGYYNAPVAGKAITQASSRAVWLASDGFWQFDGQTIAPLECTILDWVQRNIDKTSRYFSTQAVYLGVESEVWMFFPERNPVSTEIHENSLYACFNFDEKWWAMGRLSRTCGAPGSALTAPLLADTKYLYRHETGLFYGEGVTLPFAQSAAINVANGARQVTVRQGIVDTRAPAGDVIFEIGARKSRISDDTNIKDVKLNAAVQRDRGRLDFRVTGRDIVIKISSLRNGVEPWTFGQMLIKKFPRGGK